MTGSRQDSSDYQHPIFNDNKLKLGTFSSNLSGGTLLSTLDGRATGAWDNTLAIARIADEMGFEAMVPVGRWLPIRGEMEHLAGLEAYTWAAAVGACTERAAVFATSHTSTIHPIMAAKQAASIDQITGGRFAMNVVCGWNQNEMEMFGAPMLPHDERYLAAAEWLEIITRLWTEDEPFDFAGTYYRVDKALISPKPSARPRPPVMNAGTSGVGQHFAAKYCDMAFAPPVTLEDVAAQVESYRDIARSYGREIKIWSYAYVVQAETEREAYQFYDYLCTKGDWTAVAKIMDAFGQTSPPMAREAFERRRLSLATGGSGYRLIGTKDQIVDGLMKLSDSGLDGVLLSWPRYLDGISEFQAVTLPVLKQSGLR
jgi:alkanesulfonate monooxygenase SsuD/methylene tetrahydromethanopterin reductase-like flavin-dependent oxidoreductase (luciferase family)